MYNDLYGFHREKVFFFPWTIFQENGSKTFARPYLYYTDFIMQIEPIDKSQSSDFFAFLCSCFYERSVKLYCRLKYRRNLKKIIIKIVYRIREGYIISVD